MREILFRGKRADNGEWIEGYYVRILEAIHRLFTGSISLNNGEAVTTNYEVLPKTVGQYTGLTDKNGKKIFEGDIVKKFYQADILFNVGVINWDSRSARWACQLNTMNPCFSLYKEIEVEVIGNIYDNPELLKGGENNETPH